MKHIKDSKNVRIHLNDGKDLKIPRLLIAQIEMPNVAVFGHYRGKEDDFKFKKQFFSVAKCWFIEKGGRKKCDNDKL